VASRGGVAALAWRPRPASRDALAEARRDHAAPPGDRRNSKPATIPAALVRPPAATKACRVTCSASRRRNRCTEEGGWRFAKGSVRWPVHSAECTKKNSGGKLGGRPRERDFVRRDGAAIAPLRNAGAVTNALTTLESVTAIGFQPSLCSASTLVWRTLLSLLFGWCGWRHRGPGRRIGFGGRLLADRIDLLFLFCFFPRSAAYVAGGGRVRIVALRCSVRFGVISGLVRAGRIRRRRVDEPFGAPGGRWADFVTRRLLIGTGHGAVRPGSRECSPTR